ncbi:sulfatase-like hydrolase/transferase [Novosphingobium sp. AP12]|uniref:sulfatase-like hydrolase/transferase n=1 Tax=Novosphingobium sp. AP12 TaxID=1144305 RepID=UPI000272062D|nr:sulfatase-like hydrolase/transferase [Novosphingobium sp. AP12]EJL20957.1 arylsulfatase A family protein [Novosphingobium sp. AP12]
MTTIGIPGSPRGIQKEDPTLAEVLKVAGYKTGQFGKNHLGDRNDFLPTVHGFDEWFGNLYHLNAEEEPEELDYPGQKNPEYLKKYGPRGVLHAWATDEFDETDDGVFGKRGKQKIENTGPLTRKRMETFDGDVVDKTIDWLERNKEGPFFCWFNTTAIHIHSHPQKKYVQMAVDEGRAEEDVVRAKMIEHDEQVGVLLKWLDDNDLADDTIVIYSTDNGNEMMLWPDGGYAPFRGEKGTTWEGGVRVPMLARWPGNIPAGSWCNGVQNHEDVYVTLAAAAGLPDIKEAARRHQAGGRADLQGPSRRLQPARHVEGRQQGLGAQGLLLLRRDRADRDPGEQLEDAHRRQEGGQLVQRQDLSFRAVPVPPAHVPDGEDGPGKPRMGLHRPQVLRQQALGADRRHPLHRRAPCQPEGLSPAPGGGYAEHAQGA